MKEILGRSTFLQSLCRLPIFLLWFSLLPTANASDPYTSIRRTDGQILTGVVVRVTDTDYVVATDQGVEYMHPRKVVVHGNVTSESIKINDSLDYIGRFINANNLRRIPEELQALEGHVKAFDQSVKPILQSSAKSDKQKEAIRKASTFYWEQYKGIQPTLRILQMNEELTGDYKRLKDDLLPATLDVLDRIVKYQKELHAINLPTPLIPKQRLTLKTSLDEMLTYMLKSLTDAAINQYKNDKHLQAALEVSSRLKVGGEAHEIFGTSQGTLISELVKISKEHEALLPQAAQATLHADGQGLNRVEVSTFNTLSKDFSDHIIPGLKMLNETIFGPAGSVLIKRIDETAASHESVLQTAKTTVSHVQKLKQVYDQAQRSLANKTFNAAIVGFDSTLKMFELTGIENPGFATYLRQQIAFSQAQSLLVELTRAEALPVERLQPLVEEAAKFVEEQGDSLASINVSKARMLEEIKAVQLYTTYLGAFTKIESKIDTDPVTGWDYFRHMNAWLEENKNDILPAALTRWAAYREKNEDKVFAKARDHFLSQGTVLNNPEDQKRYLSFIEQYTEKGEYQRALETIEKALNTPSMKVMEDDLLTQKLGVAEAYNSAGENRKAVEIYAVIIEAYPNFATNNNLKRRLAQTQLVIAGKFAEAGNKQAAISIMETVCLEHPQFARARKLIPQLMALVSQDMNVSEDAIEGYISRNLPSRKNDDDPDTPADDAMRQQQDETARMLASLDRYSRIFPGKLANLPLLSDLRKAMLNIIRKHWDNESPILATSTYKQLYTEFPNLLQEMGMPRSTLAFIRNQLMELQYSAEYNDDSIGEDAIYVSPDVLTAADIILEHESVADIGLRATVQSFYVKVMLHQADSFIAVGQIETAMEIYDRVLARFPEMGEEHNVAKIKEAKQWDLRMERFRRPLRIKSIVDWVALVLWILVWGAFIYHAMKKGKRQNDLNYRLQHLSCVILVFAVLMLVFLTFELTHSQAFLLAFILPGVFFNLLGCFSRRLPYVTFDFFPLVYNERRLALEKGIQWFLNQPPVDRLPTESATDWLESDIQALEEAIALMNDRELFEIHMAILTSQKSLEKGKAELEHVAHRLESHRSNSSRWRQLYSMVANRLGILAFEAGDKQNARKWLNAFIEHNPKDVDTRLILGNMDYDELLYEDAIPHFKVALAARTTDQELWFRLGFCFYETGKYVAAYKCFDSAKQKDRRILFYGARSYARAQERENAIKWYQALLKKYPEDTESIYFMASTLAAMGQFPKAQKVASVIKEDDPFYARTLTLQGDILLKRNEPAKALPVYSKALELNNNNERALNGLGQALMSTGKADKAKVCFEKVLSLVPENPVACYFLGILESDAPAKVIERMKVAVETPAFRRWAARRLGYIYFFQKNLEAARDYLAIAEEEGETSPWFLYLYAHAAAAVKDFPKCEQALIKLLGQSEKNKSWSSDISSRAMYTIGIQLFQHKAYKIAQQCFEYVRGNPIKDTKSDHVEALVQESRFRMITSLLGKGEYLDAQARCAELQLEAQGADRYESCQYYLALCQLYQGQYEDASSLLSTLAEKHKDSARYRYHLIVSELGAGREQAAMDAMNTFSGLADRPGHLMAGLVTIQAYMSARKGKIAEAEKSLARLSLPNDDNPGSVYLRERILLARIFYNCHLGEYEAIQSLTEQLPADKQYHAHYLQAVSCLLHDDYHKAIDVLRPMASSSPREQRLFNFLNAQQAIEEIGEGEVQAAYKRLMDLPDPSKDIENLIAVIQISEKVDAAENLGDYNDCINYLKQLHGNLHDRYLNYFTMHNLAVLYLKRAYTLEESGNPAAALGAWTETVQFWYKTVFSSSEYWNQAQLRFSEKAKPFPENEINSINQLCRDQYFINAFIGMLLYRLSASDEDGVDRFMTLLQSIAEEDDNMKSYFRRLGEKVEKYLRSLDRNHELWNDWQFTVASLNLQVRIAEVLGLDASGARAQLELYQTTRRRYASPIEYQAARRRFNTDLLEALQVGVRGSFSDAAKLLDTCMSEIPPGIVLGKAKDNINLLREACKNPSSLAERGINLSQQFERAYAQVRTMNLVKGKS